MLRLRQLLALVPVALLAWAGLGLIPHGTHAFDGWCFDDPLLSIGGQQVRLDIGVQGTATVLRSAVSGATITVALPQGVPTQLLYLEQGAFPETVQFTHSSAVWRLGQPIPVRVTVSFSATTQLRAVADAAYPNGASKQYGGTTTTGVRFGFSLP